MDVPEHIYIHGRDQRDARRSVSQPTDMVVPEKIVVGRGGQLLPHRPQPVEVFRDKPVVVDASVSRRQAREGLQDRLSPVPMKLTANEYPAEVRKPLAHRHQPVFESQDSLNRAEVSFPLS